MLVLDCITDIKNRYLPILSYLLRRCILIYYDLQYNILNIFL